MIADLVRRSGPAETAVSLGLAVASKVAALKVLQIVSITADQLLPWLADLEKGFNAGFATRERLLEQATSRPELGMTPHFVYAALARGDVCYAIEGPDGIASYGWYSNRTTAICDGLALAFDPAYVYMYKGYTQPEYRGMRLHACGMTRALAEVSNQGSKGLVSFVERTNTASLRSVHRMGYRDVVKYAVMRTFRSYQIIRLGGRPHPVVTVCRDQADTAVYAA